MYVDISHVRWRQYRSYQATRSWYTESVFSPNDCLVGIRFTVCVIGLVEKQWLYGANNEEIWSTVLTLYTLGDLWRPVTKWWKQMEAQRDRGSWRTSSEFVPVLNFWPKHHYDALMFQNFPLQNLNDQLIALLPLTDCAWPGVKKNGRKIQLKNCFLWWKGTITHRQ